MYNLLRNGARRMTWKREAARDKVVAHLRSMCSTRYRGPITDGTEIFYDLGIYGDDVYELSLWVMKEFGVRPHVHLFNSAPGELMFQPLLWRWRQRAQRRPYKSLTVGQVLDAIEAGHWPGDQTA